MSLIGAIFDLSGVGAEQIEALRASLCSVPHDQSASWQSKHMALVAAVQHTTAESLQCPQPFVHETGQCAAVLDGYLLNHTELANDLEAKGFKLKTRSDVEIALSAFMAWGEGFADRLRGEFAVIIADCRSQRIIAARDHMGLTPLFYRVEGSRLLIASDLRSLQALCQTGFEPDTAYLAQIMTNLWYLRDATPWKGVRCLVRAHVLTFGGGAVSTQRYWEPPTDVTIRYRRMDDYVEHYREILIDCVKRSSRSHKLIGIAVSGGLDSSSLFCLADRLEKAGQLPSPGMVGYSLAAEEGGNAFELPYARAAAAHIGRGLVEVPLFDPDIDWYAQDAAWHKDVPTPSNGAMMLDLEKRVVADGSRVLINGSGGDEWLQGGNQQFREYAAEGDWRGLVAGLRLEADSFGWKSAATQSVRPIATELLPTWLRRNARAWLRQRRRGKNMALGWLSADLKHALEEAEEAYEASLPEDAVQWSKINLATSPFSDLTNSLMGRQRKKVGLQSRHPMLSRSFIEFSLRTPADIKRRGLVTKFVHREAMQDVLPQAILDRTTKANFTNSKIDVQFADYLRRFAAEQLAEVCNIEGLERLLGVDFASPEGDYWAWEIWGLYATATFLYQSNRTV